MNRIVAPAILFAWLSLIAATAARAEGASVKVLCVDESTHSGKLTGLKDGQLILGGPTTRISLSDVIELTSSNYAAKPAPQGKAHKLNGQVIGTSGSFQDKGSTREKVFDGNLDTYFDPPLEHRDDAWVGLDLGSPKIITQIKYAPRTAFAYRMVSGKFQGCNSADFEKEVATLFTITEKPPQGQLTSKDISGSAPFRYVRYTGGDPINIAEIEFWGRDVVDQSPDEKPASKHVSSTSGPTTAPYALRIRFNENDQLTGTLVDWTDKQLTMQYRAFGDTPIDIPMSALHRVWHGTQAQVDKAKALPLESGPTDAAFVLKENDVVSVRGVALGLEGDALKFKFNDEQRKINLAKFVGVILGGEAPKPDRTFHQRIELPNGDAISGKWIGYDEKTNRIEMQTSWGETVSIPLSTVKKITSANGRLTYLSDLKPAHVEQVPYFDRLLPYRTDQSLTGGTMKLIDGEYQHGIAVHSRCVLTYDLDGAYETFKTKVGFEQPEGKIGETPIRVLGDGKVLWEDPHARGDAPKPASLSLSVASVKQLTLEVDFGDNGDTGGRIDWADARLLRAVTSP